MLPADGPLRRNAAGLVPLRRNGLRQMYQSSKQPDFNIGEMMPSFSLLDEMLVRSVIFGTPAACSSTTRALAPLTYSLSAGLLVVPD
jgi:hypothetical protein